jgi:hypothetical protein
MCMWATVDVGEGIRGIDFERGTRSRQEGCAEELTGGFRCDGGGDTGGTLCSCVCA